MATTSVPISVNALSKPLLDELIAQAESLRLGVSQTQEGATIIDATGVAHVVRSQPNGPGCGPSCFGGRVTYDPATSQLRAA